MVQVEVLAHNSEYCFRKEFQLSAVPQPGFMITLLDGRVELYVKWVKQNLERDCYGVFCDATIEKLLQLHQSHTGWRTSEPGKFENDRTVQKAAVTLEKGRQRVAQITQQYQNK